MKFKRNIYHDKSDEIHLEVFHLKIFLHLDQHLFEYFIFTENLREIGKFLEKLQWILCWINAIAVSWGGYELPAYK